MKRWGTGTSALAKRMQCIFFAMHMHDTPKMYRVKVYRACALQRINGVVVLYMYTCGVRCTARSTVSPLRSATDVNWKMKCWCSTPLRFYDALLPLRLRVLG